MTGEAEIISASPAKETQVLISYDYLKLAIKLNTLCNLW